VDSRDGLRMKMDKPKVMVIGLDGATFKNLRPWMEQGLLPNLKFLIDNGVSGELETTIPPVSSPAWVSFMTGVNPGKHGVFAFVKPFKDRQYKKELVTSKDIKAKTIFEILSENKKSSGVINLPMTYPPFQINGFMISCGLTTPSTGFNFTYPNDLLEKNAFKRTDYILNIFSGDYSEKEKFFSDLIKWEEQKRDLSFKLMDDYDWDLFVLIFTGFDRLQHFYWHYIDPTHPKYNSVEAQKILPLIIKYFQRVDSIIGDFIHYIDDNTSLFIISDHGFGPLEKFVDFHLILKQKHLLYYKNVSFLDRLNKAQYKLRGTLNQDSVIYRKTKIFIKTIYFKLRKKEVSIKKLRKKFIISENYWQKIDWQRTFAYMGVYEDTVYLNVKNRDPEGIINSKEEYLESRNNIINLFNNIYDPVHKRTLKVKIYKKEEIYSGPYSDNAPDLCFEIENERYQLTSRPYFKKILEDPMQCTGRHTRDGILIYYGKKIKKNYQIKDSKIIDLAPTILYLLGIKIPEHMDGKILKDGFEEEFLKNNPVDYEKISFERKSSASDEVYSKQEIEKVEKHLSDLGYI